jgi:glutamate/tyrosine decarboxylase-like PLP-dependent enzyme
VTTEHPELDRRSGEGWHPEPELLDIRDAATSRPALERLGAAAWSAALDYVYDHGMTRAIGAPADYRELRGVFFGPSGKPAAAPHEGTTSDALIEEFRARLAPHQANAWHPRAYAYFTPIPLWASIVGELLGQVVHQGVDVWHCSPSGALVEEEVVRWLCDLVGYDEQAFGLFTSGGVMANIMALTVARDIALRRARRLQHPPRGAELEGVRVYASDQGHFSLQRSLDTLGFPADTLVSLPSDERFRLQAAPVAEALDRDRAAGLLPLAIVATAGTTNTGSVDALGDLADLADREGLWLHVDAAYGGAARLSGRLAGQLDALGRADSITIDPHKWFFQAYDIGGLLLRDGSHLERTFTYEPEYYRGSGDAERAPDAHGSDELDFYRRSMEGTRRQRALKLWLSWKHLGTSGLGRLVEKTVDLASELKAKIRLADDFELAESSNLSVVCFRHLPPSGDGTDEATRDAIDVHQDALQAALQHSGRGFLTTTRLRGRTWLRAGILNHTATSADLDILLEDIRELAAEIAAAEIAAAETARAAEISTAER